MRESLGSMAGNEQFEDETVPGAAGDADGPGPHGGDDQSRGAASSNAPGALHELIVRDRVKSCVNHFLAGYYKSKRFETKEDYVYFFKRTVKRFVREQVAAVRQDLDKAMEDYLREAFNNIAVYRAPRAPKKSRQKPI